jgi:hypothetical protein
MLSNVAKRNAEAAIAYAQTTRAEMRRRYRKGTGWRNRRIDVALGRLARAMKPVRTFIAQTQFEPEAPGRFEAMNLSFRLQRERRKLWKLRQPRKHSDVSKDKGSL